AAPHRARHRRGARPLHEGSESGRGRRGRHREAGGPGLRGRLEEEVRVLVVGAGGREHALCWALQRDAPDATLYAAPGNPGTAASQGFTELPPALAYIARHAVPLVVKASGLAGGKGAVICATRDEAAATARAMLAEGRLGDAGREIVIEQFLEGEELSVLALT